MKTESRIKSGVAGLKATSMAIRFWTGFSARARFFIVNTGGKANPHKVSWLTQIPVGRGNQLIANPLFGITTAEIVVLFNFSFPIANIYAPCCSV